jgi:O-antigen ligase
MIPLLIIAVGILVGLLVFFKPTLGLGIVLLSTLFLPELNVGSIATGTGGTKDIGLRPEDFFIILVALGWLANSVLRSQSPSIIYTPLNIPILVLSIVMIVTTILGVMQQTTTITAGFFYTLKRIQYFVVFFLVIGNIKTLKDVKRSVSLLLIFSVGVAIWSIVDYFFFSKGGRIAGPFMRSGQPPILGGFFLIIIFLGIGFFLTYKNFRDKIPMVIIVILSFLVIIFTRTRSSYVGAFIGLIIFSIIFKKSYLLVIPILLIILMNYIFPPPVAETIHSIRGVWQRGEKEEASYAPSWDARVSTWQYILPVIVKRPFLGYGLGSYSLSWIDNQYVLDAVSMGILGLSVFIWLLVRIFLSVYPFTRFKDVASEDKQNSDIEFDYNYVSALSLGYLGGLIALLIQGVAVTNFYNIRTMIPFWFLTGLVMITNYLYQTGQTEQVTTQLRRFS